MEEKLLELLNTRVRQHWNYRINFEQIGHPTLDLMKKWCEDNCQGRYNFNHVHALYFQFELERDAMLFKLRWSTADGNRLK
jgi:hypothetical protein